MTGKNTIETILSRVVRNETIGCWLWTGYINNDGYGVVGFNGKNRRVHKLVYVTLCEDVAVGYDLHHKCTNRHCCNPDHLEPLPKREHSKLSPGIQLIAARHKAKTTCPHGHLWTPENTGKDARGRRRCRACHVIEVTRYRQRRRNRERDVTWSHG